MDDEDRRKLLLTLSEVCQQVHAYCLVNNHFDAVVETPEPNLVDGMKGFLGTYTSRFQSEASGRGAPCLADGIKRCQWMGVRTAI